jgi:hypothetical protein
MQLICGRTGIQTQFVRLQDLGILYRLTNEALVALGHTLKEISVFSLNILKIS